MARRPLIAWSTITVAAVSLGAALVLTLAGCDHGKPAATTPGASASPALVETILPSRGTIRRASETTPAILLPYERTDLHARIPGFIKEIRVDYGSRVKKDEVLAVLSVPEVEKALEQKKARVTRALATLKMAEAAVRTAEALVVEAKATQAKARAEYERWKSQYNHTLDLVRRKVVDQQNLEEAQNQVKASEAGVEESKAKTESAQAALEESQAKTGKARADVSVAVAERDEVVARLQYAKVVAPYDGVVTKRHLHTGALIEPKAGNPPLLTVMRTDVLRVVVEVAERDVRYLDMDDKVAADFDGLPGKQFEWKITRLAPVLGSGKRVRVEVEIANPNGNLYPGMYGRASIILEEKPQALTVPAACLGRDDQGDFVWLAVDAKAKRARVAVGIIDAARAEIVSGLSGSEEVVCGGKEALRDGQAVTIQRRPSS